jgi:hypothetical protein
MVPEPPTVPHPVRPTPPVPGFAEPADDESDDYDGTAGLVYEAPHASYGAVHGYGVMEAVGYGAPYPHEEDPLTDEPVADPEPVANEGLAIFGDIPIEEVAEDYTPARDLPPAPPDAPDRPGLPQQPGQPRPEQAQPQQAGSAAAGTMIAISSAWHGWKAAPSGAGDGPAGRRHATFGKISGFRLHGTHPEESEALPAVRVRDLPPDVQMSFIRDRFIIVVLVGALSYIFVRSVPLTATLVIIAFVVDVVRRQRTAVLYVNGGAHPGARKATSRQLRRMRRAGYYTLDARPIPDSREVIDHLVIGPTGVYAIDSEKWNPKLPIRTWNNKKLYHGPESQKPRLEHAVWEAGQASEILSGALGTEITVRPALAIYGPKIPWDIATIRGVDVFTGSALGKYLKARWRRRDDMAVRLTAEEVRTIYDTAVRMLPDAAQEYTPVALEGPGTSR